MKRYIKATTNKRNALEASIPNIQQELDAKFGNGAYYAVPNFERICIDIKEGSSTGPVVAELRLDVVDDEVSRGKFRRATQEDVELGLPLYVREKYVAKVKKQIPNVREITNIVDRLNR